MFHNTSSIRNIFQEVVGVECVEIIPVLHRLGLAAVHRGHVDDSKSADNRQFQVQEQKPQGVADDATESDIYFRDALVYFAQMLSLQQKLTPDDPIHMAITRLNMSEALTNLSNFDEALVQCSMALKIMIEKLGDTHHTVGLTISNMAKILRAKGQYQEALVSCCKSLEILKNSLGKHHMAVGIALSEMVRGSRGLVVYCLFSFVSLLFIFCIFCVCVCVFMIVCVCACVWLVSAPVIYACSAPVIHVCMRR